MNLKTHHIAFTVNNIKESVEWYQDTLGFQAIHTYDKDGMQFVILQSGEVKIELFNFKEQTKELPASRKTLMDDLHVVGTKHLCIQVPDLDETVKNLKEKQVDLATEIDTAAFGGKYIFFKDCNGILIELYQPLT